MLLHDSVGFWYFACDTCPNTSFHYATITELNANTHLDSSSYSENPGWVHGRPPEPVTTDDSVMEGDQYRFGRGSMAPNFHICPSCRGNFGIIQA